MASSPNYNYGRSVIQPHEPRLTEDAGSLQSYTAGGLLSLVLTLLPFLAVVGHWFSRPVTIALLFGCAVLQLYVQLRFFLHMGQGRDRRWNLAALAFMLLVVVIVVLGSLWIMNNLNYHMASPQEIDKHLLEGEGMQRR